MQDLPRDTPLAIAVTPDPSAAATRSFRRQMTTRGGHKGSLGVTEHEPGAVVGYVRVSTIEQGDSGAGLEAQRRAIQAEVTSRGWRLVGIFEDVMSGSTVNGRRGLQDALAAVESGKATTLVVAKLDRLSRSLMDFAALMERSRKKSWSLVALDLGVDTTTPAGEMMASVIASVAQYERRLIGVRTKDAMAVKKANGVRMGRPRRLPEEVAARIHKLHKDGHTMLAIARTFNLEQLPTAQGGRLWYASTVRSILRRSN